MKNALLLFLAPLLLVLSQPSYGQAPTWQTALATPGVFNNGSLTGSGSSVTATATDDNGNVYVAGGFVGTLTLGNLTLPSSSTGYPVDIFVAKWLPASGTFAWAVRLASPPRSFPTGSFPFGNRAERLAVSGTSVYVGGSFNELSLSAGSTTLTNAGGSSGTTDGFVAKLTDAGTSASFAWAQRLGGSGDDGVYGLAASSTSVYVAGFFSGTATGFGSTTLTSAGGYDIFISKLTDAGTTATTAWGQRLGSTSNDVPYKLVAAGSALYLAGYFSATVGFGSTTLVSAGGTDGFVARLSDTGTAATVNWAQSAGSTGSDEITDVAVAGTSLYLAGSFSASVLLGATTLASAGGTDGFVAKLTDTGSTSSYTWAKSMGGVRDDASYRLATSGGKVYVAGQFGEDGTSTATASATFGTTVLQSAGGRDIFVTKLIDAGSTSSFAWTQQAGSTYGDTVFGLVLSSTSVYVGGYFYGPSMLFGSRTLTNPYPNGGASNGFLASLGDLTLPTRAALPAALRLYPNPANATATVPVPEAAGLTMATLTLTDALGRTVRTAQPAPGTNYLLNLTGLAPGLYVVRVQAGETLATQQLTVQ